MTVLIKDRQLCERSLPAFMYDLVINSLLAKGVEIRADIDQHIKKAQLELVELSNPKERFRIARNISEEGYAILREGGGANLLETLGGLTVMLGTLRDEGLELLENVEAVVDLFLKEIADDSSDYGGQKKIDYVAGRLRKEAETRNWFQVGVQLFANPAEPNAN